MSLEADWFLRAHPEITTIEALLPDCNGVMRGKWLPRHKLHKIFEGELKLPKTALSLDIWGRDVQELVFASGDADVINTTLQLILPCLDDINVLASIGGAATSRRRSSCSSPPTRASPRMAPAVTPIRAMSSRGRSSPRTARERWCLST